MVPAVKRLRSVFLSVEESTMKFATVLGVALAALALAVFSVSALADDQKQNPNQNQNQNQNQNDQGDTHEGTVVSATATKLVMKDKDGKEHTHNLGSGVSFTMDGKQGKLDDLKAGTKIRVTTKKGDKDTVMRVEAIDKNKDFGSGDKPKDPPK